MKDNRDRQMAQLAGWTWELNGYAAKVPFYNADDLTMREVQIVFQLDPEPPQKGAERLHMRSCPETRFIVFFLLPAPL